MKTHKKTIETIQAYLGDELDLEGLSQAILDDMNKDLKGYAADEIGLEWDGESIMVLSDFIDNFSQLFIDRMNNILGSFVGEDIA